MDGSINLKPPFDQNTEYLCVEYPGVVANQKKMLATLGGIDHVEQVHNNVAKRLDLKFRPDDPCCKPLCADRSPSTSLLLRVRKYKRKNKNVDSSDEEQDLIYHQKICGIVTSVYRFSTLCDYQYLPLRKDITSGDVTNMVPNLQVENLKLDDNKFLTRDVPLFLPPTTFGRLDTPHDYHYKKEHSTHRRVKPPRSRKHIWINNISCRKRRPNHCISVNYEGEIPTKCLPKATEVYESLSGQLEKARDAVAKAFEDRPVWSRNALIAATDIGPQFLKGVLPVIAYYVITGPWSRLWVKFGYDPKLHPEAKKYQLIDFRLRQGIHTPYIPIRTKRSSLNYKLPNLARKPYKSFQRPPPFTNEAQASTSKPHMQEAVYKFKPGVLPAYRQIFYQACDIYLPEVQEIIKENVPRELRCTKEDGWFSPNTTSDVRNLLSNDIFKTISMMKPGSSRSKDNTETGEAKRRKYHVRTVDQSTTSQDDTPNEESGITEEQDSGQSDESEEEQDETITSQEDLMDEVLGVDVDEDEFEIEGTPDDGEYYYDDDIEDEEEQVLAAASLFSGTGGKSKNT